MCEKKEKEKTRFKNVGGKATGLRQTHLNIISIEYSQSQRYIHKYASLKAAPDPQRLLSNHVSACKSESQKRFGAPEFFFMKD